MSMKSLPHKHHCPREKCIGNAKDYSNYLDAINKTKPKNKISKTARSIHSLHEKALKQSKAKAPKSKPSKHEISEKTQVEDLKRRNQELEECLQDKSKKINEMKNKIKDYQAKVKQHQFRISQLQAFINENDYPKSPISLQKPSEAMMNHYQQQLKLVETSQKATIDAMEKYHLIEKDFHEYRNESERKIERLVRENEQLRQFEPDDKTYDEQISSLRKELHRLSQMQQSPIKQEFNLEQDLITIKTNNKQLMIQKENLSYQLHEKEESIQNLRKSLQAINKKVDKWNEEYRKLIEERRAFDDKYNDLQQRYVNKKERQIKEKEQWAAIFRELMKEVEKLKRQISRLERSNHKLSKLYTEPQE